MVGNMGAVFVHKLYKIRSVGVGSGRLVLLLVLSSFMYQAILLIFSPTFCYILVWSAINGKSIYTPQFSIFEIIKYLNQIFFFSLVNLLCAPFGYQFGM